MTYSEVEISFHLFSHGALIGISWGLVMMRIRYKTNDHPKYGEWVDLHVRVIFHIEQSDPRRSEHTRFDCVRMRCSLDTYESLVPGVNPASFSDTRQLFSSLT